MLIFRVEAALLYFSAKHILNDVLQHVRDFESGLQLVIGDLSNSPGVDLAGARRLARFYEKSKAQGVGLRIVEAHAIERDILRAEGLEHLVGPIERHSVADALAEFNPSNR